MDRLRRLLPLLSALALLGWGSWIRLRQLDARPMHTDEAVQAVKFGHLLEEGVYRYDPVEYHGPTLYYAALLPTRLTGARTLAETTETHLRLVPAVAGIALLLLVLAAGRRWDAAAALAALGFAALSPMAVYYARYFIQETLLVTFTGGLLLCLAGYFRDRRAGWAAGAGVFAGLMHASKETCVISFAGIAAGIAVTLLRERVCPTRRDLRLAGLAAAVAAAVSVVFFSSFFTHARGPLDSLLTYGNYIGKSEHSAHEHPAGFYLRLLAGWREPGGPRFHELAALGFALAGVLLHFLRPALPGTAGARFLAFHLVVVAAAYFSFDYKTPWLLLNLLLPLHLLAGWGVVSLARVLPRPAARAALGGLLALAAWDLGRQVRFSTLRYPAGPRNPFAYVHTSRDLVRLAGQVRAVAAQAERREDVAIHVMAPEYWPLPWYLRDLPNVGYWHELDPDSRAPIVIVSSEFNDRMEWTLDTHKAAMAGLRPGVSLTAYYRQDWWDRHVGARTGAHAAPVR